MIDEVFTAQGLDVVDVDFGFEPQVRDNHPNAASTRRLAEAVTAALRPRVARK